MIHVVFPHPTVFDLGSVNRKRRLDVETMVEVRP